jgi:hypothetical protein
MKPIQQVQRSTVVPSLASSTSTLPKGASAALQSVQALDTAQAQEKGGGFKKAIVAALIGITLITSVAPAHADTTAVVAPQTASLVLQQDSTGPPGDALAGQQRFERFLGGAPHLSGTSQIATDVVTRPPSIPSRPASPRSSTRMPAPSPGGSSPSSPVSPSAPPSRGRSKTR